MLSSTLNEAVCSVKRGIWLSFILRRSSLCLAADGFLLTLLPLILFAIILLYDQVKKLIFHCIILPFLSEQPFFEGLRFINQSAVISDTYHIKREKVTYFDISSCPSEKGFCSSRHPTLQGPESFSCSIESSQSQNT